MQIPDKTAPRLFLVDAYALIYRSYFAFINRPLTNSRGENTSAPFGFTQFLLDIREKFAPDYLAVVFDAGDSGREEIFPEYKATREKMPDDLRGEPGADPGDRGRLQRRRGGGGRLRGGRRDRYAGAEGARRRAWRR